MGLIVSCLQGWLLLRATQGIVVGLSEGTRVDGPFACTVWAWVVLCGNMLRLAQPAGA